MMTLERSLDNLEPEFPCMPVPRYSVVFYSHDLNQELQKISQYLRMGVKVLWFGTKEDTTTLSERFPAFIRTRLLQPYVSNGDRQFEIIDGDTNCLDAEFRLLEETKGFNYGQFLVEHSKSRHIVVEASAGTGKTTVMVDRIMFLLHTVKGLKPSQISMITFTNEATDQMNKKLQQSLLDRFRLTGNTRYLDWLEDQSQMNISTIHSFALTLIKKYGTTRGYSKNTSVKSFRYDIDKIITTYLDENINTKDGVEKQIGLPLHKIRTLIHGFWDRMVQLGIPPKDLCRLEWGETKDTRSAKIQRIASGAMEKTMRDYRKIKQTMGVVSLSDMTNDLEEILHGLKQCPEPDGYKFLFVDEFQDSDDSQIRAIVELAYILDLSLFVVGDIKQSIYRFRGADDSAFETFDKLLRSADMEEPSAYSLSENYRTSPAILFNLHECFNSWNKRGLLNYKTMVKPTRYDVDGGALFYELGRFESVEDLLAKEIRRSLDDLRTRVDQDDVKPSDKVVVLTRTNAQLQIVSTICKNSHIPCIVKKEGNFYTSDAVRDFYSAVSSFMFNDPIHIFNYLVSPYSSQTENIDIGLLRDMNGDRESIESYLEMLLEDTSWPEYNMKMKTQPFLSVVKDLVRTEPIVENYMSIVKGECMRNGWNPEETENQVRSATIQYRADLDKLMDVLQRNASSKNSGLYSACKFLELMMSTNRDEESVDINDEAEFRCVNCMTVHKAKGLEFDTVLIPFTNKKFNKIQTTELLFDKSTKRVGWHYVDQDGIRCQNENYQQLRWEEDMHVTREECRILYVAMTRSIRKLIVYIDAEVRNDSWGELLVNGGVLK